MIAIHVLLCLASLSEDTIFSLRGNMLLDGLLLEFDRRFQNSRSARGVKYHGKDLGREPSQRRTSRVGRAT